MRGSFTVAGAGALLLGVCFLPGVSRSQNAPPTLSPAEKSAYFEKSVWPILQTSCIACHAGPDASGKLDLTQRATALKGGASGPALTPGDPAKSLLIRAIHYDGREMPPQGKLSPAKIAILTRWIGMGAPWSNKPAPKNAVPVKHGPPPVNAETMRFWSFQKVKRPAIPTVKNAAWLRNPIDAFVLSKLEKNGLKPAAPAGRAALIRRAYYDMTGLPPTPEEVRAFVADTSPRAWETVVDRLLASPEYGERWGRHWLDLVRYAETNSFERDGDKPFAWRYRDYVIRAFNTDKPYDVFVREQLAGDEIPGGGTDALIATGYYRLGTWDDEPADREQARFDDLDDIVSTTGQTMLGMAVGCARCHDSKIDPLPQKDYYKMLSFFRNIKRYGGDGTVEESSLRSISPPEEERRFQAENAVYKTKLSDLDKQIVETENAVRPTLGGGEIDDFKNEQNRLPILKKRLGKQITAAQFADYEKLTDRACQSPCRPAEGTGKGACRHRVRRRPGPDLRPGPGQCPRARRRGPAGIPFRTRAAEAEPANGCRLTLQPADAAPRLLTGSCVGIIR